MTLCYLLNFFKFFLPTTLKFVMHSPLRVGKAKQKVVEKYFKNIFQKP